MKRQSPADQADTDEPTGGAEPAAPAPAAIADDPDHFERPAGGGVWLRQADGSLTKEATDA